MNDFLIVERDGAVATVTLNRPDSRNAVSSFEDCTALEETFRELDADRSVHCVIFTANGKAFSAGGDLKKMRDGVGLGGGKTSAEVRRSYQAGVQRVITTLAGVDVPIVTAVNGPAVGLGCDLACFGDVRIASDAASFAMSFVKVGLVPGDGGAWLLPRRIGMSAALQMILTGDAVAAGEAKGLGLVSEVVSPDELLPRARAIAEGIARNPAEATRMAKRLVRASAETTLAGALDLAAAYQAILHKTADHHEAVDALITKRTAKFTGD